MKRPASTPPDEPHDRHRRNLLEAAYALVADWNTGNVYVTDYGNYRVVKLQAE